MKYKKLLAILLLGIMLFSLPSMASAQEITHSAANQISISNVSITPRSDVIVTKYRTYNNKKQYRRWNETRNRWVDSYWINLPNS